jgi:hypothetical protein
MSQDNSCSRCGSLGILHLKAIGEPQESLVFCGCSWSKLTQHVWKLPVVTRRIEGAFTVQRCPSEWFKPGRNSKGIDGGRIVTFIRPSVDAWLQRVRRAETFWEEYAPIFCGDDREGA